MPVEIPLTKGFVALVDDADAKQIGAFRWRAIASKPDYVYAATGDGEISQWQLMHRLILGVGPRYPDVDHRNGNGLDNQRHNLRTATRSQNCINRDITRAQKRNGLGLFGIFRVSKSGSLFKGRIHKDGKSYLTSSFPTPVEAAIARDQLAIELHGEFASLNFPDLRSEMS